jgi:hypothetical protein
MYVTLGKFEISTSPAKFTNIVVEYKRGDENFKSKVEGMTIQKGDSEVVLNMTYMRSSVFFKEKTASTPKTGPTTPQAAKYQEKHLTIKIYGKNEDTHKD